jgi:hypothetical protein
MNRVTERGTVVLPAADALLSASNKAGHARRRVRILLRRVAIWLDRWGLRGYPHDTHDWGSKTEQLRNLKNMTHASGRPARRHD